MNRPTRISRLFEELRGRGQKALIAYITAGDPTPEDTPRYNLIALADLNGDDFVDLVTVNTDEDELNLNFGTQTAYYDDLALTRLLPGDANVDGTVNADDFALIDKGFAAHLAGWSNGDFNGDGVVDQNDYLIIDAAFLQHGGADPAALLAERESQFGTAYVQELLASVPEPASLAACGFALLPLLSRRRPN